MKTNNKGFSLVELIVVIAIMAILAAVAIPTFAGFISKANKASDESYMNDIKYAIELTFAEDGGIPAGHEVRVKIDGTSKAITYAVVKTSDNTAIAFTTTDVEAMVEDNYTAKGLTAGTYHKVGDHWETCTEWTTPAPGGNGGDSTPTDPQ